MTTYTLQLRVRRTVGALGRVLDYLRKRHLDMRRVVARPTEDGDRLDLTVTVEGTHAPDPRLVSRLSDVERVVLGRTA